jgi:rRNA biogenesis protein RRP5
MIARKKIRKGSKEAEPSRRSPAAKSVRTDHVERHSPVELVHDIPGVPKSKLEFDKKLIEDPNNSKTWVQFAAFTLETESVEAARKLLERALSVINFSRYADKDNLWKALINLEFNFGDAATLRQTVLDASNARDPTPMLTHVLSLCCRDAKFLEGEDYLKLLLKKGENKMDSWLKHVEYYLEWTAQDGLDAQQRAALQARIKDLNKRALQSLDRRDHITYLNRYAVLEYKAGREAEGRTQFENILSNFPKRADIWWHN